MNPEVFYISESEFDSAPDIYKLISHDNDNRTFAFFEINNQKYYIGWISSSEFIKVEFLYIKEQNFLVVGVDLKVAAIGLASQRILFSLGLFSYFKYFKEKDNLSFIIYSELEDIVISKNGLSISQIVSHDLEF